MQFSLSAFGDILSEFQKYLSNHLPKAVYFSLGLVVVALGAIIGYVIGLSNIITLWNKADISFQIILVAVASLIFFILANVLGSLQGAVERWFQGDLPFRLGERLGFLERHRDTWQGRSDAFHQMTNLYSAVEAILREATEAGLKLDPKPKILQTARALPRYHIINQHDLIIKDIDNAPSGSLQDPNAAIGMLVQHPLDEKAQLTKADLISLPENLKDPMMVAITLETEKVPAGLVPGDMIIIFRRTKGASQYSSLNKSLIVDVQQVVRDYSNGTKVDLTHFTLAVPSNEVEQLLDLPSNDLLCAVRATSNSTTRIPTTTIENENRTTVRDILASADIPEDITHLSQDLEMLRQQHQEGQNWLQHMQSGSPESCDALPYIKAVANAFVLFGLLHSSPGMPDAETLCTTVNGYMYKLIEILIAILDQQYVAGKEWFKRLQTGTVESFEANSCLDALVKTFLLLNLLRNSPDTSESDKLSLNAWRVHVNQNRNLWIALLENASDELIYRIDQSRKSFYLYYPITASAVAPTAIGNVLRAVDSYAETTYGLDTALVLPRLQVVMEQNTRDQLSKAHDQLALLEWLYLGIIIIGVFGTIITFATHHYFLATILWLLVLPIPQIVLYPAALMSALDYASALRLAYDRERGKVINMMGFSLPAPTDQKQEKALWLQIQKWWEYGTPPGNYTLDLGDTSSGKNE